MDGNDGNDGTGTDLWFRMTSDQPTLERQRSADLFNYSTFVKLTHTYTQAANAGKFLSIILALIHRPGLKKIRGLVPNAGLKKIQGLVPNAGTFQSTGRASKRFEDWFLTLQLVVNLPKSTRLLSTTSSKLGYYYIMGRPRLYHTSQDKIEAARSYRKKYYAKRRRNSAIISKKNRQKSCKQHNCPTNNDVDSQSRSRYSVRTRSSQRHPCYDNDAIPCWSKTLLPEPHVGRCQFDSSTLTLVFQGARWSKTLLPEPHVGRCQFDSSTLTLVFQVRLSMCNPLWVDIATTPYMAEPEESVTVYEGSFEFDEAVYAMADECFIFSYLGIFYNMPAKHDLEPPFYCVTYGRYIGVFPSYLW
ncbi:hypothetical protein C8R48DRAFT_671814 [Suillus tomentosus]|nr:hypothetical protein C8R48DRAFT_671814 [Suillus tomentosus]